jgi:hypothetical protein
MICWLAVARLWTACNLDLGITNKMAGDKGCFVCSAFFVLPPKHSASMFVCMYRNVADLNTNNGEEAIKSES